MSHVAITYVVVASAAVFGFAAFAGLILVPAWGAYSRLWERIAATVLSLYVLVAFVGLGVLGGGAVIYFWDRL